MAKKVIVWRLLSILLCTLAARLWFGDWHVTMFGIFLSVMMTFVHYWFEKAWDYFPVQTREWFEL
tara:strand:+ start:993 stop:1187 length:195 start_codon:yes stop_codon:yes gene_type:complete